MSTSIKSIAGTTKRRSKKRSKRCNDVVKAGKARYIGASSMYAWQFMQSAGTPKDAMAGRASSRCRTTTICSIAKKSARCCRSAREQGIGVIPWSPLARGRLTRDYDETSERQQSDVFGNYLYGAMRDADRKVVEAVAEVAKARGVPRAQVALAWVAQKNPVTAPIIGASKLNHLDDAAAAIELKLTSDEIAKLEAPYVPHPIVGF